MVVASPAFGNRLKAVETVVTEQILRNPGVSQRVAAIVGVPAGAFAKMTPQEQSYLLTSHSRGFPEDELSSLIEKIGQSPLDEFKLSFPEVLPSKPKLSVRRFLQPITGLRAATPLPELEAAVTQALNRYLEELEQIFFSREDSPASLSDRIAYLKVFKENVVKEIVKGNVRLSEVVAGHFYTGINSVTGLPCIVAKGTNSAYYSPGDTGVEVLGPDMMVFYLNEGGRKLTKWASLFPEETTFELSNGHFLQKMVDLDYPERVLIYTMKWWDINPRNIRYVYGKGKQFVHYERDFLGGLLQRVAAGVDNTPLTETRGELVKEFLDKHFDEVLALIQKGKLSFAKLLKGQVYAAADTWSGEIYFIIYDWDPLRTRMPFSAGEAEILLFSNRRGQVTKVDSQKLLILELDTGQFVRVEQGVNPISTRPVLVSYGYELENMTEIDLDPNRSFVLNNHLPHHIDQATGNALPRQQRIQNEEDHYNQILVDEKISRVISEIRLNDFLKGATNSSAFIIKNLEAYRILISRIIALTRSNLDPVNLRLRDLTTKNILMGTDESGNLYLVVGDGANKWLVFEDILIENPVTGDLSYRDINSFPAGTVLNLSNGGLLKLNESQQLSYFDSEGRLLSSPN